MTWVFWSALGVMGYTYAGYPLWLWLRKWLRARPVMRVACEPKVSVVMVVRNEEAVLADKLRNLLDLDYPAEKCEVIVVSDGSTDGTERVLHRYAQDSTMA